MIYGHTGVKFTGTDAHKRDPVAMRLIHIRLDLKHKSGKVFFRHRIDLTVIGHTRERRCSHFQEMLQESLHSEVRQCRTEKHRGKLSLINERLIELCRCAVQKFYLFFQERFCLRPDQPVRLRTVDRHFLYFSCRCTFSRIRKEIDFTFTPAVHTLKCFSRTDRPVDRAGWDPQFLLDIIQQIERIFCIPVHFVDKCKDRDMAHRAYLKKFSGLRLHAFRCVDHHYCGIRGHQRTVRILREILMSRCVQDIDAVSVIIELKYG